MESLEQVRKLCRELYALAGCEAETAHDFFDDCTLHRDEHAFFEWRNFKQLPKGFIGQDSGQPWFLYWLTNGIEVCNQSEISLSQDQGKRCIAYLKTCHNDKDGGFCGAPGLQSHLASTYAAVMAIVNLGVPQAYDIIDIPKMRKFLLSIKNNMDLTHSQAHSNNSWIMKDRQTHKELVYSHSHEVVATLPGSVAIHENGEMDMRGVYCSLVVADILNIVDDQFTRGMGDVIASCQTYEGGIACAPFGEAHGGYTFCGLAALTLLGE